MKNANQHFKTVHKLWLLLPALIYPLLAAAEAPETKAIPLDQLGAEAGKQYQGEALGIAVTPEGARLRCGFQKLEGRATAEGLWLESTEAGGGKLRVVATAVGRSEIIGASQCDERTAQRAVPTILVSAHGTVSVTDQLVRFVRPGVTEEYTVSVDGVRQDFIVVECPPGDGDLRVELELQGARAEATTIGAKLKLEASGRELAYTRLRASDATGRELDAKMETPATTTLLMHVDDANAVYPVRIDPTFSDADWVSLNNNSMQANTYIWAVTCDLVGNIYVGGRFTSIGGVAAASIAKWDGQSWSALAEGLGGTYRNVYALAVVETNLYAGGLLSFGNNIAKWDGNAWSTLGSGVNSQVNALVSDGTNLYAGGQFYAAGSVQIYGVGRWNGSTWSSLSSTGPNGIVSALLIDNGILYVGGYFTKAGNVTVNGLAKWNGTTWSSLGSGFSGGDPTWIEAIEKFDGELYAGGDFTTAGGSLAFRVARWNGTTWSNLGSGVNGPVYALKAASNCIYVGGGFSTAGGAPAKFIASWSTNGWSSLGSGVDCTVESLTICSTGQLIVGGGFTNAGTTLSPLIAQANIAPQPFCITAICLKGGLIRLDCLGNGNINCSVERATDVRFTQNVVTLITTNTPRNGAFSYTDPSPPNTSAFYRLRVP